MKVNPKSYYAANDYTSSKQENKPKKAETGYAAFAEKLKKRDEEQNLIQNVKKELNKETHEAKNWRTKHT